MFKRAKRNTDFSVDIEVVNKLPRLDFIEMMEDSYDVSMIDYLADEFTNKIIQDPSIIRNKIKDKINELVYGVETKDVNPQITDSVTQLNPPTPPVDRVLKTKPKTTTKPRLKKETTGND
jgi:division protein CdvB (Snf7/Vps24/ESCRT-III family)